MRKDVRLGLAVGGILFVGVMAYALFFTGGEKPKKDQASKPNPVQTGGPAAQANSAAPNTAAQRNPDPQPVITDSGAGAARASTGGAGSPPSIDVRVGGASNSVPDHTPAVADTGSSHQTPADADVRPVPAPDPASSMADAASAGGGAGSGSFDWNSALERGTGPLLARSETPMRNAADVGPRAIDPSGAIPVPPVIDTSRIAALPATRPSAGPRSYVVKPGETFWTIAKAEYGNGAYVSHLTRANPKISPSRLRSGMTIFVPDKNDVVPAAGIVAVVGPTTRPFDAKTQYRVQSGDSLFSICKKLYGGTDKVEKLYQLNKAAIGPNPAALKLNMVLQLPEAPAAPAASPTAGNIAGAVQ